MTGSIVLIGFMGAGKTTVGEILAKTLGMKFTDTDEIVERRAGKSIAEIFETEGEEAFRVYEHRAVRHAVRYGGRVIACGGGAILQIRNHELLREAGPIVYLRCSSPILRARLRGSEGARPLLRSRGGFDRLLKERAVAYETAADLVVNGDGDPEAVAEMIVAGLR